MTKHQFEVIAGLLALVREERDAAYEVLFNGAKVVPLSIEILDRVRQADLAVRAAYVLHGPMDFRIVVGHRDTHRAPGALRLHMGDIVKLVPNSTERWVPVRITALPATSADYYRGVVAEQPVKSSRYEVGNGVKFSEDQVLTEAPRASSRRRPRSPL